jgi:hypothetical protein
MTHWQLSLGPNDYTWIKGKKENELILYPKGSATMTAVPLPGDDISISCRATLIAKGKLISFGSIATVQITSLHDSYMKGRRRNWTRFK